MRLDQTSNEVSSLIGKIERGELDLQPNFQRGQVWGESKKKRLIDSILRDWYIPPIHIVVNERLDREEVLDGQQRLRSIFEFVNDAFPVDGRLEPFDENIFAMDGLYYSQLPRSVRSNINRFSIMTVRLRDYRSGEPGELFFRLNQLTALTAAEQRNALFGEPRDQIRRLAETFQKSTGDQVIGFSNARMNYDDVLSRLAVTLESGGLAQKVTASRLESRYRSGTPFPRGIITSLNSSIGILSSVLNRIPTRVKFNKATLFSWLFFVADNQWTSTADHIDEFRRFLLAFEIARSKSSPEIASDDSSRLVVMLRERGAEIIQIFNDRSTSRVNDVSSVLLRDFCLNASLIWYGPRDVRRLPELLNKRRALDPLRPRVQRLPESQLDRALEEAMLAETWGQML